MHCRKFAITCISLLLFISSTSGQHVDNVAYFQGSDSTANKPKTYITYDLIADYENIACLVKVKLTAGERSFYLMAVSGDVGDLIYPGTKKSITWDHVEELVHFSGGINLSIEVTPSVQVSAKIKRGKQLAVVLAPIYTANKSYAIKLYRAGMEVARLSDVLLIEKSFPVLIPKKTKAKKKYQLVITDGEKTYFSNTFKVKPRISRAWVILPALAVPAYLVINQTIENNKPLPGPPIDN